MANEESAGSKLGRELKERFSGKGSEAESAARVPGSREQSKSPLAGAPSKTDAPFAPPIPDAAQAPAPATHTPGPSRIPISPSLPDAVKPNSHVIVDGVAHVIDHNGDVAVKVFAAEEHVHLSIGGYIVKLTKEAFAELEKALKWVWNEL